MTHINKSANPEPVDFAFAELAKDYEGVKFKSMRPPIPVFLRPDPAVWEPDDSSTDMFHPDDGTDTELTRAEIIFSTVWWIGLLVALITAIVLSLFRSQ